MGVGGGGGGAENWKVGATEKEEEGWVVDVLGVKKMYS